MATHDIKAAQQRDIHLQTNVFSAGYAGLKEGVSLTLDKGPDPLRPRDPSMAIGNGFIARDRFVDRNHGPMGCIYHPNAGLSAVVFRAIVHTVTPEGRKPFSVLRTPTIERPSTSLIKVATGLPKGVRVRAVRGVDGNDHLLRVWRASG